MQPHQNLIRLLRGVPDSAVGAEARSFTALDTLQQLLDRKVECVCDAQHAGPGAVREAERSFSRAQWLAEGPAPIAPCSTDPGATATQVDPLQADVRQLLQQQLF